jgi:hypothetical protein
MEVGDSLFIKDETFNKLHRSNSCVYEVATSSFYKNMKWNNLHSTVQENEEIHMP